MSNSFEERIATIREHYDEWLDKQDNLLELPISEIMGNAFFDGYEKGQEIICKKILEELKAEKKKLKSEWKSCFLSCSSPYCAGHFPEVKMQGELGNMSKREGE